MADKQRKEKFLTDLYADEKDPQLKEFLEVMAPRTKKTTWQNADTAVPAKAPAAKQAKVSLVKSKRPGGDGVYLTKTHITFEDEARDGADAAGHGSDDDDYQTLPSAPDSDDEPATDADADAADAADDAGPAAVPATAAAAAAPADAKAKSTPSGGGRKGKVYPAAPSIDEVVENGRLFVRNLSFACTEEDLRKLFEPFGPLSEVHIPIDKTSKAGKGFAYILFLLPEHAVQAMTQLDGKIFQVRRKSTCLALTDRSVNRRPTGPVFRRRFSL